MTTAPPAEARSAPEAVGGERVLPARAEPAATTLAWLAPVAAAPGAGALPLTGGEPVPSGTPSELLQAAPHSYAPSTGSPPGWQVRLVEVRVPPLPPEAATVLRALAGFHVTTEALPSSAALAIPGAPAFGPGLAPTFWEPAGPKELGLPSSQVLPARPGPGVERRGFWFNVNAELIVYGATEPDALVTIDGEPVALRPDGSFTLRFALPDGDYALSALAVAAAGDDSRSARLQFLRRTAYRGQVGKHPTDPALKPPAQKGPE